MKTLSIVIPTLGREQELIATVKGLLSQTHLPLEIVIIDQNTPPLKEVDLYLASVPLVRHIHSPVKGVTLNYNRCVREARGDILLFVDDDVIPTPQLVEMHLENYSRTEPPENGSKPLGGVAGRILQEGSLDPAQIREVGTYHRWKGSQTANFNGLERVEIDFAQGANMSFLRTALLEVGGFDQEFDGNGYFFETDGCLRVLAAGYRMVFDPRAELVHLMAGAGGARIKDKSRHTYYFVKNGIRLYKKHSPALGLPFYLIWLTDYVMLKAIYNRDPAILRRGYLAVWDGIWQSVLRTPSGQSYV